MIANEQLIKDKLNKLIETSVFHGGDSGGPYCSCQQELEATLQEVINILNPNWEIEIRKMPHCVESIPYIK